MFVSDIEAGREEGTVCNALIRYRGKVKCNVDKDVNVMILLNE